LSRYIETYNAVIEGAENLPQEIKERITVPEAIYIPPGYLEAPTKILIAGSEAYGGGLPLMDAQITLTAQDRLAAKEKLFQDVVVALKKSTPFWRQFDWIAEGFGLAGREAIAYSNVCRVQRIEPVNDRYSLNVGPPLFADDYGKTRMAIGAWQSPLVELEWATLKPDVVIVSSIDGHQWLSKTFPALRRKKVWLGKYPVEILKGLPCPTFAIRHPGHGAWSTPTSVRGEFIKMIQEHIDATKLKNAS
jgi:hypothetical protein